MLQEFWQTPLPREYLILRNIICVKDLYWDLPVVANSENSGRMREKRSMSLSSLSNALWTSNDGFWGQPSQALHRREVYYNIKPFEESCCITREKHRECMWFKEKFGESDCLSRTSSLFNIPQQNILMFPSILFNGLNFKRYIHPFFLCRRWEAYLFNLGA